MKPKQIMNVKVLLKDSFYKGGRCIYFYQSNNLLVCLKVKTQSNDRWLCLFLTSGILPSKFSNNAIMFLLKHHKTC